MGLLGIQEDRNGSFHRGPAKAPALIRSEFDCGSGNTTSERGIDVGWIESADGEVQDFGDIPLPARSNTQKTTFPTIDSMYEEIAPRVREITDANLRPLILGGDHSITYPVVKALASSVTSSGTTTRPLTILHFDAHPDFYPDFGGNPASHASPFARIMEDPDVDCQKLVQIGIRTLNAVQKEHMESFSERMHVISAHQVPNDWTGILSNTEAAIYISVDMDVLDPAFAPGVSHRESGGLSVRQVLDLIHSIPSEATIIGADIVEYNVDRDVDVLTASAAAKIMKELVAKMVQS